MNFTESFQDFSTRMGPTDWVLYAGIGLVVWVLFQDKLNGIVGPAINYVKGLLKKSNLATVKLSTNNNQDKFFELVSSWKKTRDLAEQVGCVEAVKAADAMFPYLSPIVCGDKKEENV